VIKSKPRMLLSKSTEKSGALHETDEVAVEMLYACHDRVERQCETLVRLAQHLVINGSDEAAQQASHSVLRYFNQAAPNHHADEERDVFPALLNAAAVKGIPDIAPVIERLLADHRELEQLWVGLSKELEEIAEGMPRQLHIERLNRFVKCYREHIEIENQVLFPKINELLADDQVASIGLSMRQRRGIDLP